MASHPANQERGRIFLVNAFGEERKASHRPMLRLAGLLAHHGYSTCRVDAPGTGESTGQLNSLDLDGMLADLHAAMKDFFVSAGTNPCWAGGCRLGATLIGILPQLREDAIAWLGISPVLNGAQWINQLRTRKRLRTQMTGTSEDPAKTGDIEDLDGLRIGPAWRDPVSAIQLARDLTATQGAWIQAGPARSAPGPVQSLASQSDRRLDLHIVRMEPFWERGEAVDDAALAEALLAAVAGKNGEVE